MILKDYQVSFKKTKRNNNEKRSKSTLLIIALINMDEMKNILLKTIEIKIANNSSTNICNLLEK